MLGGIDIKRYSMMFGFIGFILLAYFFATIMGSVIFGLYYGFMDVAVGMPLSIDDFISQHMIHITMFASILALVIYWLFFLLKRDSIFRYAKVRKTTVHNLCAAILMGIAIYSFLFGLLHFLDVERVFPEFVELMAQFTEGQSFIILLLGIGLVVPVFEEFMYRGIILNRLRADLALPVAIVLQALFFGLMHMNLFQSSYAFVAGILIGLAYVWTGSLWVPIMIHIAWNSTSVLISHLQLELSVLLSVVTIIFAFLTLTAAMYYFKNPRIRFENGDVAAEL